VVEIIPVSPYVINNFSSERTKAVYAPLPRVDYRPFAIPTNGLFVVGGEPEEVREFKLEPIVQGFSDIRPRLTAESIRTKSMPKIQATHEKLVIHYDGRVLLGIYLIEGEDAQLKVVATVHGAFSDENREITLEKLTQRLAALKGFVTKGVQIPTPNIPDAPDVRYVAISRDYNVPLPTQHI